MRQAIARKPKKCKRGHDIWSGDIYYPQRRGKCLCFECGRIKPEVSFLNGLFERFKRAN